MKVAVVGAVMGCAASAMAYGVGDVVKDVGKAAGKGVAEKQINDKLSAQNCAFKGKTTEASCNFNAIVAALKAGQMVARESGEASIDIKVEAYGPDSATAKARAEAIRGKLRPIFSSWNYDVYEKTGGNDLVFSVRVR